MTTTSFQLADLFEAAAAALPDHDALVCGGLDRPTTRSTYAELDERANRVANQLAERGVGIGDRVGIHLFNGPEFVELTLALFKLRAVPINLNYRYVAEELRHVLADAEARLVVTETDLAERVVEAGTRLPGGLDVLTRGAEYDALAAAGSTHRPDIGPRSGDDQYLLYTGGTTGMPKGVIWRHEDLFFAALSGQGSPRNGQPKLDDPAAMGDWVKIGTGITRRLPLCPLMHGGANWAALTALLCGGTCVLSTDRSFDAASALTLMSDEAVELLMIIGDAVARPLVEEIRAHPDHYDLSALQLISSSGAILSASVAADWAELVPTARLLDRFGASETGGQGRIVSSPGSGKGIRLATDANSAVLDDDLRPVAPGSGIVGRLARTGWIPLGYLNDPDKTAATFPVVDGVRWSIPGDMATIEADGSIMVLGRGSMVINSGGEKVFPEEVESAVKSHPAIYDAIVVGVPDERFGSRVCAVVALRDGAAEPSIDEVREHCASFIAGYKTPRAIAVAPELRRTATGKADYPWARDYALAHLTVTD